MKDELIEVIALFLLAEKVKKDKIKRRCYVRGLNLDRKQSGAFATLVRPMRSDFVDDHFNYFRMTHPRFDDLLQRIAPKITHANTHRMPINALQRLAMTLRFLCDGGSLAEKAYHYKINHWTLSNIIKETTKAIWEVLMDEYLKPPTREKWQEISTKFWTKWNFPLALGAIDGKHIAIKCPPKSESLYYNYKGFFSIVLLALADAEYNFILVDIGGYGHEGDAGLFHKSSFGERMRDARQSYENGGLQVPNDNYIPGTNLKVPHVFLGDEAFPLGRHLMKPYQRQSTTGSESAFNFRLSRARRVVENAFGVMMARFRALEQKINLRPEMVDSIVKACVVLHNYLKYHDVGDYAEPRYMPSDFVDYLDENGQVIDGNWRRQLFDMHNYANLPTAVDESVRLPYNVREKFKNYFISEEGKLPWQDEYLEEGHF